VSDPDPICKVCGEPMSSEGGISEDMMPPVITMRYRCPNGHVLYITTQEETDYAPGMHKETWKNKDGNPID